MNPNRKPYQNIYLSGSFQNLHISGHVGAPPPATATSGPISRRGPPPAALSRSSFPSNGAPVGPPNGPPSMIRASLAQSFRGPTHGSRPPNQSFNAPPGLPSASYMANQNLNPVSQTLRRQTQQRPGGMSGVIPPVRMRPAAMGQQPMTPPHAGAQIRRWKRQRVGGEPSIRNPVVQPPKKTLPDLLKEHTLPPGLFPKDITDFQFDEKTRKIAVTMPDVNWELICDSCVLRFSKTVTGLLERGKLSNINGMKTQTGMTYGKISCIKMSEQRKELIFRTDQLSQTKRFLEFKDVKNGRPF